MREEAGRGGGGEGREACPLRHMHAPLRHKRAPLPLPLPPAGLGIAATARKFLEVLGLVWAGSQVTKLARAAG